jgi:glyoxylase I family protein
MVLMVIGLDHVSIFVADLTKATAFYEGVLRLKRLPRPDLGFDGVWLSLQAGQTLHLMCLPNPDITTGRVAHAGRDRHIALRVARLEDIKAALTQANIVFTQSQSGRNSIFCRDADGNGIEFLA